MARNGNFAANPEWIWENRKWITNFQDSWAISGLNWPKLQSAHAAGELLQILARGPGAGGRWEDFKEILSSFFDLRMKIWNPKIYKWSFGIDLEWFGRPWKVMEGHAMPVLPWSTRTYLIDFPTFPRYSTKGSRVRRHVSCRKRMSSVRVPLLLVSLAAFNWLWPMVAQRKWFWEGVVRLQSGHVTRGSLCILMILDVDCSISDIVLRGLA